MDATTTTQALGMHYIWIDSLCIVQDDLNDWQEEAANMAAIYEFAVITIAASWGADSGSGCFHDYLRPLAIDLRVEAASDGTVDEEKCRLVIRPEVQHWNAPVVRMPLDTRKWTLQEEVLSPRTLCFTEGRMHWSCAAGSRTEDALPLEDSKTNLLVTLRQKGATKPFDSEDFLYSWTYIVSEYSKRSITFASDKLAAIAGISRVIAEVSGETDIVGMWTRYLTSNLLWSSVEGHCQIDTLAVEVLNLPTWSWLKSPHPVDLPFPTPTSYGPSKSTRESLIKIIDTSVEWEGIPMTSKILEARIKVIGLLLPIVDLEQTPPRSMSYATTSKLPLGNCMCFSSGLSGVLPSGKTVELVTSGWKLDECVKAYNTPVYCLLFSRGDWDGRYKHDPMRRRRWMPRTRLQAMIVTHADITEQGSKFIRLGVTNLGGFPFDLLSELEEQEIELV